MVWRIARWLLVVLLGLYFAANAVLARALIDFKLNGVRPDAASHHWAPLLTDMGPAQSVMWLTGVALYGAAAVMLALRRRGAVFAYAGGVLFDFLNWRMLMTHASYIQVFGPGQEAKDRLIFIGLVVLGGAFWFLERRAPRAEKV
jgi:hypothetical protein